MFGTRNLFLKSEEVYQAILDKEVSSENLQYLYLKYLKRLYQQSKQISQITAYIWRWADVEPEDEGEITNKEVANKLKKYFELPTTGKGNKEPANRLKELFGADPRKRDPEPMYPDPAYLLKRVFWEQGVNNRDYIFPIFDKYELGDEKPGLGYSFEITFSSFMGQIVDADNNAPTLFKMIIPYPARPQLGDATLTKEDLDDWITNRQENEYFSKNPYIPTTCS